MNNQLNNDQDGKRPDNKDPRQGSGKNHQSILAFLICLLVTLVCFALFTNMLKDNSSEISYDKFIDMVDKDQVKEVTIQSNTLTIVPKKQNSKYEDMSYYTTKTEDSTALTKRLEGRGIKFETDPPDAFGEFIAMILSVVLPTLLLFGLLMFSMRRMNKGGGIMGMGVGKSKAKAYVQKETGVTFKDVAGQDEAKESLQEVVDFLHNPGKYTAIGAKLPKGALLVGPPGTGKTLLAKAVAGEAQVPFFSLSGSEFVEMFVGVGASRVRDLFEEAKKNAPCIVFIDEIDAIGKKRDGQMGGNDEREQTLNQLLSEMDGFDSSKGIIILGATNRPEVLDKALLRPGRFDRRIIVEKPDLKGRVDVLKVHSHDVLMDDTVDLEEIALATSGAVGADLANMVNEAAIMAVKDGRQVVSQKDLFEAVEVVLAGKEKKDRILGEEEKKIVAYHEIGHALVATNLKHAEPVQKITIVPRTMGALGYVMQVPEEEKYLMKKEELISEIVTLMGGRAAEQVKFDDITTGASNDIEKATSIARSMVTQYGMSSKFGMMGLETIQSRYLDGRPVLNCGEVTESQIDEEVMAILNDCYKKAVECIETNQTVMDKLAEHLIEKETITGKEFVAIYEEITGEKLKRSGEEKRKEEVKELPQNEEE